MSREAEVVAASERPVTPADVAVAIRAVGVEPGSTVIVHSSLSRVGWVVGGAIGVVSGLLDAVGTDGTIVMPAQTGVSDPSTWQNPPVPESWWPVIRATWPAFDPRLTPMRAMGAVAECFARLPEAVHSGHPAVGFVAHGPLAGELMHPHDLEAGLGDDSPLGRLYERATRIVLIGVGHGNDTSLHLAEHRADWPGKPWGRDGAPMTVDGERHWVEYGRLAHDDEDFETIAAAFEAAGGEQRRAPLGHATVTSCAMRPLIDFAVEWMSAHRGR
ncbi:MAG: AAC(3) family N-acetyltransferase [Acidimicrobiales bacterium]